MGERGVPLHGISTGARSAACAVRSSISRRSLLGLPWQCIEDRPQLRSSRFGQTCSTVHAAHHMQNMFPAVRYLLLGIRQLRRRANGSDVRKAMDTDT